MVLLDAPAFIFMVGKTGHLVSFRLKVYSQVPPEVFVMIPKLDSCTPTRTADAEGVVQFFT